MADTTPGQGVAYDPMTGKPNADAPLQAHLVWYVNRGGYQVASLTLTDAQLRKPTDFSWGWAFLSFTVAGFGIVAYLAYWLDMKRWPKPIYLYVEQGKVKAVDGYRPDDPRGTEGEEESSASPSPLPAEDRDQIIAYLKAEWRLQAKHDNQVIYYNVASKQWRDRLNSDRDALSALTTNAQRSASVYQNVVVEHGKLEPTPVAAEQHYSRTHSYYCLKAAFADTVLGSYRAFADEWDAAETAYHGMRLAGSRFESEGRTRTVRPDFGSSTRVSGLVVLVSELQRGFRVASERLKQAERRLLKRARITKRQARQIQEGIEGYHDSRGRLVGPPMSTEEN